MKAYPCLGGPLDGQFASTKDFVVERYSQITNFVSGKVIADGFIGKIHHPAGQYSRYRGEYFRFNCGERRGPTTMVWLHRDLLRKPINVGK